MHKLPAEHAEGKTKKNDIQYSKLLDAQRVYADINQLTVMCINHGERGLISTRCQGHVRVGRAQVNGI